MWDFTVFIHLSHKFAACLNYRCILYKNWLSTLLCLTLANIDFKNIEARFVIFTALSVFYFFCRTLQKVLCHLKHLTYSVIITRALLLYVNFTWLQNEPFFVSWICSWHLSTCLWCIRRCSFQSYLIVLIFISWI